MWTKSHSTVTKEVTKEQMWKLYADVNNWHKWDKNIEYAKLQGSFEKGNFFELKPIGGPKLKIEILEAIENMKFTDLSQFPLAKMQFEHLFEETAKGLKITQTISMTGILSFLWIKLIAQDLANGLSTELSKQITYASTL